MGAGSQSFDLTATEAAGFKRTGGTVAIRVVLVVLLLGGLGGQVFALPVFVHDLADAPAHPQAYVQPFILYGALVAWSVAVAILLIVVSRHGGRDPVRLEVWPEGFTFGWKDGYARTWVWATLKRRLEIHEIQSGDFGVDAVFRLPNISWASLTKDAMHAIVDSARSAGMRIREVDQPSSGFELGAHVYFISRP